MRALLCFTAACLWAAVAGAQPPGNQGNDFGGLPPGGLQEGRGEGGRWGGPRPNTMFQVIDADDDGVITRTELRRAVAALKTLDADNDGNITLAEVSPAGPGGLLGDPAQMVDRLFEENDKNGDGKLTADEVPEQMQRMLQNADTNGDGAIDRTEAAIAMENMRERFRGGPGRGGFRGGPPGANAGDRSTDPVARIMQWDANGNGLSADEIPPRMQAMFQPADDKDNNGVLDAAELQAVVERMGGGARAIGAGGDPNTFRDPNRRNRPPGGRQN